MLFVGGTGRMVESLGSDLWPPRLRESSASPGTLKMPESPPFSAPCFCTHTLVLAPIPH